MLCILILLLSCNCLSNSFILKSLNQYTSKINIKISNFKLNVADNEDWMKEPETIHMNPVDPGESMTNGGSLFDAMYNVENDASSDSKYRDYSFSRLSVRDISELYGFSIWYLGDLVVQLGCSPPVDPDARVEDLLTGNQIFNLMEAVTTLDVYETNADYDSMTLKELVDEVGISMKTALKICRNEGFNLPYGPHSTLHNSIPAKFSEICNWDQYQDVEGEEEMLKLKDGIIDIFGDPIEKEDDERKNSHSIGSSEM